MEEEGEETEGVSIDEKEDETEGESTPDEDEDEDEPSLYDERFLSIFESIATSRISKNWKTILYSKSPSEWLEVVRKYTPRDVITMLSQENENLTKEDVLKIPWEVTGDAGIYYNLLAGHDEDGISDHLYVGAASAVFGSATGLRARKASHLYSFNQGE